MERLMGAFDGEPPPLNAKEVTDRVFERVREYVGDFPQSDDITCLAFCATK